MATEEEQDKTESSTSWLARTWERTWKALSVPALSIVLALLIGAIIIWISGSNPIVAYSALLKGAFGSPEAIQRTLEKATPLVFAGLAVAFAFKAGLFNIGGSGQLLLGAIVAGYIGFAFDGLPFIIHMPLALLGGSLAGALWAAIAGARAAVLSTATAIGAITFLICFFSAVSRCTAAE